MHLYHTQRTVYWGNWGIDFFDVQKDTTKNYGVFQGAICFPVGSRGPIDNPKEQYKEMIKNWIDNAILPDHISRKSGKVK